VQATQRLAKLYRQHHTMAQSMRLAVYMYNMRCHSPKTACLASCHVNYVATVITCALAFSHLRSSPFPDHTLLHHRQAHVNGRQAEWSLLIARRVQEGSATYKGRQICPSSAFYLLWSSIYPTLAITSLASLSRPG